MNVFFVKKKKKLRKSDQGAAFHCLFICIYPTKVVAFYASSFNAARASAVWTESAMFQMA